MPLACNFIKNKTPTQVFSCEFSEFLRTPLFQNTSNCFWILQMEIKLLKMNFLIDGFTYFEVSYTNHNTQWQMSEGLQISLLNHVKGWKYYTSVVRVACCFLWLNCIRLRFVCSRLWLICTRLWLVCYSSVVLVTTVFNDFPTSVIVIQSAHKFKSERIYESCF